MSIKKKIENPEQFQKWVLEKASDSSDYVQFYREVQNKYLDCLINGIMIEKGLQSQFVVWGEAFKIASKEDPALHEFIDKAYKVCINMNKELNKINDREEQFALMRNEKFIEKYQQEIVNALEQYKVKAGDYRVLDKLYKSMGVLEPMSYGGEFSEKMRKVPSVENKINYGSAGITSEIGQVIQKMRVKYNHKLLTKKFGSLDAVKQEMNRLFG